MKFLPTYLFFVKKKHWKWQNWHATTYFCCSWWMKNSRLFHHKIQKLSSFWIVINVEWGTVMTTARVENRVGPKKVVKPRQNWVMMRRWLAPKQLLRIGERVKDHPYITYQGCNQEVFYGETKPIGGRNLPPPPLDWDRVNVSENLAKAAALPAFCLPYHWLRLCHITALHNDAFSTITV